MTEPTIAVMLEHEPAAGAGHAWPELRPQPASAMVRTPITLPKGGDNHAD